MCIILPYSVVIDLQKCVGKKGKLNPNYRKLLDDDVIYYIENVMNIPFRTIFHLWKENIYKIPTCQTCGKPIFDFYKRDVVYCSTKCINKKLSYKKAQETWKIKYGVDSYTQTLEFKNKIHEQNLIRSELDKQKIIDIRKNTNLIKYGVESYAKTEECKDKIRRTSLERYGVENYSQTKECQNKIKETNLKKYGYKTPLQNEDIKIKIRRTSLERYGVENYSQTKECQNKIKETNIKKYGCERPLQNEEIKRKYKEEQRKKYYTSYVKLLQEKNILLVSDYDSYIHDDLLTYKCLHCNTIFKCNRDNPQRIYCNNCISKNKVSSEEKNIYEYIRSIYTETILENDRNVLSLGKELDIYIPDKNVAIEYNGSYWHCNYFKDKTYHLNKTLECREKGIRLIHIFEYEWENKREICRSIISSALGIYKRRLYARACTVRNISFSEYKNFLEENHIQGSINSSLRLGLSYEGELVSVIGFGKSRFKNGEYELHRFCTKLYTQVVGGFSKLIKHSGVKEFISYIDLSKFNGYGYISTGFKILEYTEPSYVYVRNKEVLRRMSCQKHKLHKLLENYDENKTEEENMLYNGYVKLYDCGNIKVCWK